MASVPAVAVAQDSEQAVETEKIIVTGTRISGRLRKTRSTVDVISGNFVKTHQLMCGHVAYVSPSLI